MNTKTLNNTKENVDTIIEKLALKFNLGNVLNTEYREELKESELKKLGKINCFYTVEDMELVSNVGFDKDFIYQVKYGVSIESISRTANENLIELSMFLSNEYSTNFFLKEEKLKNELDYKCKIRNAMILANKTYIGRNNNIYYKQVISFEVYLEIETNGGFYKWQ